MSTKNLKKKKVSLAKLIKILSKFPTLKRIRYLTSHPLDITDELINEHKTNKKLMPFLHLPVQAGSNKILKKMNRKHLRQDYLSIIAKIRQSVPQIAFSSDFIVGYPGETNSDFEDGVYSYVPGSHKKKFINFLQYIINIIRGSDLGIKSNDGTFYSIESCLSFQAEVGDMLISDQRGVHGDLPCTSNGSGKIVLVANFTIPDL